MPSRISFLTLGCAKNIVDSSNMQEDLVRAGYDVVDFDGDSRADVIILNTCAFIQPAIEESIDTILDIASLDDVKSQTTKFVVCGCLPARFGDELTAELPEVDAFVPCAEEPVIVEVVDRLLSGCSAREDDEIAMDDALFGSFRPDSPSAFQDDLYGHQIVDEPKDSSCVQQVEFEYGPSEYVKISDGCSRRCAFCTIPFIRGPHRSFSFDQILNVVESKVRGGAKEIVLIAQDTGIWGCDLTPRDNLASLLGRLADLFPSTWFRIMYLEPDGVSDELIEIMKRHPNICNYLDIPLQHVDPSILRSMNRRGSRSEFEALIARIRKAIPDIVLRTTLIVGYPGETDEHFDELCDFISEIEFDYVGVFAYSVEDGTKAASLPCHIDDDTKQDRLQTIRDIADAVSAQRISARVGSSCDLLVLGAEEDGQLYGRCHSQAPEVDGVTYIEQGNVGDIVSVTITDTLLYEMEATLD